MEEYLDETYGKIGTKTRTDFDIKAKAFAISEIIKDERKQANMTQEELARRTAKKPRYSCISRPFSLILLPRLDSNQRPSD